MTYEQMKFKLGDYLRCRKVYKRHMRELELLEAKLLHVGSTVNNSQPKVKKSAAGNAAYAEWIENAMFMAKQLKDEKKEVRQAKKAVARIINRLESQEEKDVLRYKFLHGWRWNEIARVMNFSEDWARHISYQAIRTLAEKTTTHNHL